MSFLINLAVIIVFLASIFAFIVRRQNLTSIQKRPEIRFAVNQFQDF